MRLDLHIHSTASDGTLAPEAVLAAAVKGRLDAIALTDHDTTAGVLAVQRTMVDLPLQVIPAIEVSSTLDGRELHFLGYFVDPAANVLLRYHEESLAKRASRMSAMVEHLREQGLDITMEDVIKAAGSPEVSLGRPHLARALFEKGLVSRTEDAFQLYIGNHHPAFIPTELRSPPEAIQGIHDAGGLAFWAHPPRDLVEELAPGFVSEGLDGIEVYRPRNRPDHVLRLEELANRLSLLTSGGSDWHGPDGGTNLGDFFVTSEEIGRLLEAGGM